MTDALTITLSRTQVKALRTAYYFVPPAVAMPGSTRKALHRRGLLAHARGREKLTPAGSRAAEAVLAEGVTGPCVLEFRPGGLCTAKHEDSH